MHHAASAPAVCASPPPVVEYISLWHQRWATHRQRLRCLPHQLQWWSLVVQRQRWATQHPLWWSVHRPWTTQRQCSGLHPRWLLLQPQVGCAATVWNTSPSWRTGELRTRVPKHDDRHRSCYELWRRSRRLAATADWHAPQGFADPVQYGAPGNKVVATQSVPVQCGALPAALHGSTTVLSEGLTDELETDYETTSGSTQLVVSCDQDGKVIPEIGMINPTETCGAPLALPSATVISEVCRFLLFEMSVVVLSRRSTFIDEDLGDVADLSARHWGRWRPTRNHSRLGGGSHGNHRKRGDENLAGSSAPPRPSRSWSRVVSTSRLPRELLCRCLRYRPWVSYSWGHHEGHTVALVSTVGDGKMAPEALVKTAVSGAFSLLIHMSLLTLRGPVVDVNRRSTLYDETLGDVVDLSGHGTWADEDFCEIVHDSVSCPVDVQGSREPRGNHWNHSVEDLARSGLKRIGVSAVRCILSRRLVRVCGSAAGRGMAERLPTFFGKRNSLTAAERAAFEPRSRWQISASTALTSMQTRFSPSNPQSQLCQSDGLTSSVWRGRSPPCCWHRWGHDPAVERVENELRSWSPYALEKVLKRLEFLETPNAKSRSTECHSSKGCV